MVVFSTRNRSSEMGYDEKEGTREAATARDGGGAIACESRKRA
jgi:hypothetical protein